MPKKQSLLSRSWVKGSAVIVGAALALVVSAPAAHAAPLQGVESVDVNGKNNYVVDVTFTGGTKGRITFLEDGVFRYNVDPSAKFDEYAKPKSNDHVAHIQAQPDSSTRYKHPVAKVSQQDGKFVITAGDTTITLEKATAKMVVKSGDKVVLQETAPLDLSDNATVQSLDVSEGENFFGGGTQNGRFTHRGETIKIANTNNWVDGGVASPNPFYWSSDGYGVLRNTFAQGNYDFAASNEAAVKTTHSENEFDAYYFVSDAKGNGAVAQELLDGYFSVTGNPVLLPEYGFYLGHLNAYNRDSWTNDQQRGGKSGRPRARSLRLRREIPSTSTAGKPAMYQMGPSPTSL